MKKLLVLAVVMSLALSIFVVGAFAVDENTKSTVEDWMQKAITIDSTGSLKYSSASLKAYIRESADEKYSNPVTLSDGVTVVYYNPEQLDALETMANKVANSEKVGEKVNQMTEGFALEADVAAASTMLSGFKPILQLVIGIIVLLITFGMTLFSSFDVAYIAFPVFRNKCEDYKQEGNRMMTKKTSNGGTQLRWVTDEAQYAVQASTTEGGTSPWGIYFKKRVISYIFLAIILFTLVTGNISIITDVALKVVQGIMDVLSSMA